MPLPADPEQMNDQRAAWAGDTLEYFATQAHHGPKEPALRLSDLLCDLRHYCDRAEIDFAAALSRADDHYFEETHE